MVPSLFLSVRCTNWHHIVVLLTIYNDPNGDNDPKKSTLFLTPKSYGVLIYSPKKSTLFLTPKNGLMDYNWSDQVQVKQKRLKIFDHID